MDAPLATVPAISRATDREVVVVAAVLVAGSEKAAAHRLGLAHSTVKHHHLANARSKVGATTTAQLVWILAPRLPEPEGMAKRSSIHCPRYVGQSYRRRTVLPRHRGDRTATPWAADT